MVTMRRNFVDKCRGDLGSFQNNVRDEITDLL